MEALEVIARMEAMRDDAQREVLMNFFKTGPGEYADGDQFLGLRVPQTRAVTRDARDLPLDEVVTLLGSEWHEVRLCGLLIMVDAFERLSRSRLVLDPDAIKRRDEILMMYLEHAECANNWDLVDLSAPKILGGWLLLPTALPDGTVDMNTAYKLRVLDSLADSGNLWRQRMSVVCTWKTTQQGDPSYCLRYAERHLSHPHDLMHKAVGWMLREMGKRAGMELLRQFLERHLHEMSRTTLRYAIEKMTPAERRQWLTAPH